MPAPTFNLTVNGAAPNQFTTEALLEQAVNAVLASLWNDVTNSAGKSFTARANAVSYGQENLPDRLGLIYTREGTALVTRGPGQTADDPLFPTYPNWGVITRIDPAIAMRDSGLITLANVGGTGDAITADLPLAARQNGVTATGGTSVVELIPTLTNTGSATLAIEGGTAAPIRDESGAVLTAGALIAGRSYLLRRRNTVWRIISGAVAASDLTAEVLARTISSVQTGTVALVSVGTGDAMTASVPTELTAVGMAAANLRRIRWQAVASNTGPMTINIDGQGAVSLRDAQGDALLPGYILPGRFYEAIKVASTWRIVSGDVTRKELNAEVIARVAHEARTSGLSAPGDGAVVVEDRSGKPVLGVGPEGDTYLWYKIRVPVAPGDYIATLIEDAAGKTVLGFDIRDGSLYPPLRPSDIEPVVMDACTAPGDYIIPVVLNADGTTAFGIDRRDGSPYPLPESSGGGSTGGSVEFVDPDNFGDTWNSIQTSDAGGSVIRFLSRQWRETWGYEKRGNVTLAQTPSPAVGMVAFGGGSAGVVRHFDEDFRYHLVNEALIRPEDGLSASAQAVAFLDAEFEARRGLPTVIAMSHVIGSTVEADALPGAPGRAALVARVAEARAALIPWGKALFVDRISLSLLEGAPDTPRATADLHYAAVANGLRIEVAEAAGQAALPLIVVSQSAGTRTNGASPVILAEGNLDWEHWALGIIVAGPRYPYELQEGSVATLTPDAAALISEIEALAVAERLAGRDWFGPSIGAQAHMSGAVITVPFTAMSNLIIRDPSNHGFAVDGISNAASITSVSVSGSVATITLSEAPLGSLTVRYAFGEVGDRGDGKSANRGSLTDSWELPSRMVSGTTLYRYARSGAAPVIRQGA